MQLLYAGAAAVGWCCRLLRVLRALQRHNAARLRVDFIAFEALASVLDESGSIQHVEVAVVLAELVDTRALRAAATKTLACMCADARPDTLSRSQTRQRQAHWHQMCCSQCGATHIEDVFPGPRVRHVVVGRYGDLRAHRWRAASASTSRVSSRYISKNSTATAIPAQDLR